MEQILWVILAVIAVVFIATVLFGAPFVPTHYKQLKKLVKWLDLTNQDVLVDLGSGDGRVLRVFGPQIKQAIGYEINPFLVLWSKISCHKYHNIKIKLADFRLQKLPAETTIIYLFYANSFNRSLQKILKNRTNLTIISYGFKLDWLENGQTKYGFWIYKI